MGRSRLALARSGDVRSGDALGMLWDALGRSGDALRRSGDALGRSGSLWGCSGTLWGRSGTSGTSVVWPPTYWRRFLGAIWTPIGVATYILEKVFCSLDTHLRGHLHRGEGLGEQTGHPLVWPRTYWRRFFGPKIDLKKTGFFGLHNKGRQGPQPTHFGG